MNHPNNEQWMSYLYEEVDDTTRADLAAHLHVCPECRQLVDGWEQARTSLDAWQLPPRRAHNEWFQPALKWGLAAAIVLTTGFGLGRVSSANSIDVQQLRAELRDSVQADVRQKLLTEWTSNAERMLATSADTRDQLTAFIQAYANARVEDRQLLFNRLQELERQRAADYAGLRRDLETVAVLAENRIESTREQLGQLVTYTRPNN